MAGEFICIVALCGSSVACRRVAKVVWMDGWIGGWIDGWTDRWMEGWMDGRMVGRVDERMDGKGGE